MGFFSCTSKYVLFLFNLACALLGLTVVGVSTYALIHGRSLKAFLEGQLNVTAILLICVGAAVFLIAFFGCCGAIRENQCYLNTYGVILSALLLIQIALGVLAFVYRARFQDDFKEYLSNTFNNSINGNKEATDMMNDIQKNLECCGVQSFNDYNSHKREIPPSCCKIKTEETCPSEDSYQEGCSSKGTEAIKYFLQLLGIIAIAVGGVELLGVIFAFCLANSIKRNEMRGYA